MNSRLHSTEESFLFFILFFIFFSDIAGENESLSFFLAGSITECMHGKAAD